MPTLVDFVPLAAGGLSLAASYLHGKHVEAQRLRYIDATERRERNLRFAAHSLMAASRISPAAVIEALDHSARSLAPEIDGTIFATVDGETLSVSHARGMHAAHYLGARLSIDDPCALAHAYRIGHRVTPTAGVPSPIVGEPAFLAIPLLEHGRTSAVIAFTSRSAREVPHADAIVSLTEFATTAYMLSIERRADIESATIDALTGLFTPRAFRDRLYEEVADARAMRLPLSLLFIDTDHFKSCNDTLGHAAGDIVLQLVAAQVAAAGGGEAIPGRNGGDEFCLLMRSGKSTAIRHAEALRAAIAAYPFADRLGAKVSTAITLSIGVASFPDDADDASTLLERADAAMYHSKRSGRNRVSFVARESLIVAVDEAVA